ncbi:MAG: efflux RND transporter permease subunit [Deltaproteobacteria bacterium]|nr:efflux RND transporter permease subunit [Deltaproteobacteria bacterium]
MSTQHPPIDHDAAEEAALPKRALRGPISWMARNSVAANLVMFVIFVGGLLGLSNMKQEVFPEFTPEIVNVTVPYPGASPEEVEQGIVLAVEEAVRGVDDVKRITASANEGVGTVTVELNNGANLDRALNDVKASVDRISTFPEDAEQPIVSLASRKRDVISVVIAGDQDLAALHALGEQARARLLDTPEISQVEIFGVPPLEIGIELRRETIEGLGLSLENVAQQVTAASLELPGGEVETAGGELLVRTTDRKRTAEEFADIVLRGTAGGATLRLGDVATITDGYQDNDLAYYFNGQRAVKVTAYRIGKETPSKVADAAKAVTAELDAELPDTITVATWKDDSEILEARISLLMRNAWQGLIIVVIVLALFLDLRLALWIALGIPTSFAGVFLLGPQLGVSINMVSLFALIIVLGIVVDDAIVIGENIYEKIERGVPRLQACIEGTQEMAVPVVFSVLTTIAAFSPLLIVPGFIGRIFGVVPLVVIAVLTFSLLEGFFVLPSHLRHGPGAPKSAVGRAMAAFFRVADMPRAWISVRLDRFIRTTYRPMLATLVRWRYATVAGAFALFLLSVGLIGGRVLSFTFFPKLEGNQVTASARLPYGAPLEDTEAVRQALEASLEQTIQATADQYTGGDRSKVVRGVLAQVGQGFGGFGGIPGETGSQLLAIEVNLVTAEEREFGSKAFSDDWFARSPTFAGVDALVFNSNTGPGGNVALDVQLSHPDTAVLGRASAELAQTLRGFDDLRDIDNTFASGKPQLDFTLLPNARTLGLTSADVARQLRASFFGAEALREQRGRNEMKVMVRLPKDQRSSEHDIESLRVRTPGGGFATLGSVARFERGQAPTSIKRESGVRIVNVKADIKKHVKSNQAVVAAVTTEIIPNLRAKYPGLDAELVGNSRDQAESLASLRKTYLVAFFVIFTLLAIPFKSYIQPMTIMMSIPIGFFGSVVGHLLHGYDLSIISIMGIIACSGVSVNDSLVLVDAANQLRREEGLSPLQAVIDAGARRMRPILLTSLTTFFGLWPIILETSVQARFLIPMAISLAYGVAIATFGALLVVPALYIIVEDLKGIPAAVGRLLHRGERRDIAMTK